MGTTLSWQYASNQFAVVTARNYLRMNVISEFTESRLKKSTTSTAIGGMATAFAAVRTAYSNLYTEWKATRAKSMAATQRVYELLSQLSGPNIRKWDARLQVLYDERSVEYRQFLPNGREPFYRHGIEERIADLRALLGMAVVRCGSRRSHFERREISDAPEA